jgi:hypothetical protein
MHAMTVYARRYLLAHGVYLAAVLCLLAVYGLGPGQALARFDGQHYLQIASSGYVHKLSFLPDGKPDRMDIAFFPLYPLLMAALHAVTRLPMELCGLVLSLGASLATALGLGTLLEPLYGRRTALLSVTIWAVGIDGIVESMLYAQPLIAAFAVWGAVAVRRRRMLPAALCAIGAGLSHSTGLGLIVVVMAGAALAVRDAVHKKAWRAVPAPAAAFVLAPTGLLGYIAFLALRFHRADAWFLAESAPGWSSQFDAGKYSLGILFGQLDGSGWSEANGFPHFVASVWLLPAAGISCWLLRDTSWWRRIRRRPLPVSRPRVPWELTLATLVTFALVLSDSGPWSSKPRFLIPCLALVVPPALWLDRLEHRPRLRGAIVLAVAAVSVLSCFYLDGPSPAAL